MKLNFNLASTARITVKQMSVNGKFHGKFLGGWRHIFAPAQLVRDCVKTPTGGGWGCFRPAYKRSGPATANPPTPRLRTGVWTIRSPKLKNAAEDNRGYLVRF